MPRTRIYRGQYPQANFQIIETADEPVGAALRFRESNLIRILDITVLPEHRSAGIGTTLVQEIIAEANRNGQAVTIWIEQDNPAQGMFNGWVFNRRKTMATTSCLNIARETDQS
jgi:ribosomal protein S18 acetylase RimI-like enzyme